MVATREFKPSLRNLTEALAHDIPRTRFDIWIGRCMPVLVLGCVGWLVFALMTTEGARLFSGAMVGLVAGGMMCVVLGWVVPRLVERTRAMRPLLTRRRYTFDSHELVLETADGVTARAAYRSFRKVSMGPGHIAFYDMFPGYPTYLVTSKAFESKDQERVARDWIAPYAT